MTDADWESKSKLPFDVLPAGAPYRHEKSRRKAVFFRLGTPCLQDIADITEQLNSYLAYCRKEKTHKFVGSVWKQSSVVRYLLDLGMERHVEMMAEVDVPIVKRADPVPPDEAMIGPKKKRGPKPKAMHQDVEAEPPRNPLA